MHVNYLRDWTCFEVTMCAVPRRWVSQARGIHCTKCRIFNPVTVTGCLCRSVELIQSVTVTGMCQIDRNGTVTCDGCTTLHNLAQCCASPKKISVRILMNHTHPTIYPTIF